MRLASLNETVPLTATVHLSDGTVTTDAPVSWSSLDPSVASVSTTGVVTAVSNGSTSVLADTAELSDTVEIVVTQVPARLGVGSPHGPDVAAGRTVSVVVMVQDALGSHVPGSTTEVTLEVAPNSQGAVASGTLTAQTADGLVTFDDIRISRAGRGFVLIATATEISGNSDPFDVRLRFSSISVGREMTCALSHAGDPYCWGRNQTGGLGTGSSGEDRARPTLVAGDLTFTQVTAGVRSNEDVNVDGGGCGLTMNGEAWCWGRNDFGQLGNGSLADSGIPVRVAGGIVFQSIGMGMNHTCGLDVAGHAYCWGDNAVGQLGDGNMGTNSGTPIAVTGGLTYTRIFVGHMSGCGLAASGDIYCWGSGGPTSMAGSTLVDEPTLLGGGLSFAQVDPPRELHFCGVTQAGGGYCWGQDQGTGRLGTGTPGQDEPEPAAVAGGHNWEQIGVGSHFSCGLREDARILCWGTTVNGTLGNGSTGGDTSLPVEIIGGITFTQLSVGAHTVCGVTDTEDAYCWGSGFRGERGDGTFVLEETTPARVLMP